MNSLLKITLTSCVLATIFFSSVECSRSLLAPQEVEDDIVMKLCKKTQYYDLCMTILFPDSRRWTSDTKGLAKIVIEKDITVSKEIMDDLQSLAQDKGKAQIIRQKCSKCYQKYKEIMFTLMPNANKALDSGKFGAAVQNLNSIANYAKACDDEFSIDKKPFVNMNVHDISMLAANIVELI